MDGYRIFARSLPLGSGPPRPSRVTSIAPIAPRAVTCVHPANPIECEIVRIVEESVPSESVKHAFDRKESELRVLFAGLTVAERATLHAKLSNKASTSPAVVRFARMAADRRVRLLALLGDDARRSLRNP